MKMKTISFVLASLLLLSGCSMWNNEESGMGNGNESSGSGDPSNGTANASNGTGSAGNEGMPKDGANVNNEDSISNMMNYLNGQGVEVSNMEPIDTMDFAAHEGSSFTYNGTTAYLYRLKSDDENMKALLEQAKKNGTVKVNMDGTEQNYSASVNGNYLFVYKKDSNMNDLVSALGNYVPGATTTTPNTGGDHTTTTNSSKTPSTDGTENGDAMNTQPKENQGNEGNELED